MYFILVILCIYCWMNILSCQLVVTWCQDEPPLFTVDYLYWSWSEKDQFWNLLSLSSIFFVEPTVSSLLALNEKWMNNLLTEIFIFVSSERVVPNSSCFIISAEKTLLPKESVSWLNFPFSNTYIVVSESYGKFLQNNLWLAQT